MTLRTIYTLFFSFLTITLFFLFTGYINGPATAVGQGFTGAPGETGSVCGNCHNLLGSYGQVLIFSGSELEYTPLGVNDYQFVINTTSGFPTGYGFQATVVDNATGDPVSLDYVSLSSNLKVTTLMDGRQYVEHDGISGSNVFSFSFVTDYPNPAAAPDVIAVHFAGNAVNGDNTNNNDSGSPGFVNTYTKTILFPVALTDFKATSTQTGIQLDWATETEQDNDYFAIEHGTNGSDFNTIKTIEGAGTTDERNTYAYTHTTPVIGNNYYRLRQVDFDGKETFSEIVVEKFDSKFNEITVFPQPATTEATIYFTSLSYESGTMAVYDISGRLIHSNDIQLIEGENYLNLNCENWIAGHYVIHIRGEQIGEETIRFLKK